MRTTAGQVKELRFDADGVLIDRSNNGISEKKVLRDGRTEIITHPTGVITRRDYDEFGNLIREVKPDAGVTTWEYEPLYHQPVLIVDPRGATTVMAYDANGNLTNRIEAFGTAIARTNSWLYDTNNQLVRRIDGRDNKTDYVYDNSGNLIREFDPDNPAYQTTYSYDLRGNRIAITNALGYTTLYGYDVLNRLVAETNALGYVTLHTWQGKNLVEVETGRDGTNRGRIVRYRYDDHDRRTHVVRVDGAGVEHVFETTTYDADGRVATVANALNQTTRYEYNALGQRVKISRPFSATETSDTQFIYDEFARLSREIDPLDVITLTEYDELDRERKVTEALGTAVQRSRERRYDLNGNLTSITYSDGTNNFTTFYDYDLLNRRVAIRGAREYPKQFEYDANHNLVAEINGRDYRTEYAYDHYSRRTNTVEGIGRGELGEHAGSFEYDLVGNVVTAYDGNWNHRHYHHDALGRQTEQSIPLAHTNAPPTGDWWTENSLVLNHTWFNPWGQPIATSNIVGGVTVTFYDDGGRRFTHTDAAGLTLTNEYNANDQLLAIYYPVVSSAPPGSPPTSIRYTYDEFNAQMLVAVTDRANLTTRYGYDHQFQRIRELSSWNALTTYRYDELGRQTAVTNALFEVTQSVFDQFDQLVGTIHPDHEPPDKIRIEYRAYSEYGRMTNHWGTATYDVTYAYDLAGNHISLADGNGNTTRWRYDGRNRRIRKTYADDSIYEYGYDANGNQVRRRDGKGQITRNEFNAHNLQTRIDYPNDPDVLFDYDAAGRLVQMVDNSGTNMWAYDAVNRVATNSQFNVDYVVSYQYDSEGNRLSLTVTSLVGMNNWLTDYAYDAAGRMETILDHRVSENPFRYDWQSESHQIATMRYPSGMATTFIADAIGRRRLIFVQDPQGADLARFDYTYDRAGQRSAESTLQHIDRFSYDFKRQLVSAQRYTQTNTPDPAWSYFYDYDPVGNWKTAAAPEGTRRFAANKLNQYEAVSNTNSHFLSYDGNGALVADELNYYAYDDADRLVLVSNAMGTAKFSYDGLGRRFSIESIELFASITNFYVYDGILLIAETSSGGSVSQRVTRGLDFALTLDELGGIGGLLSVNSLSESTFLASDSIGHVRVEALEGGIFRRLVSYSPYGLIESNRDSQPLRFSSKEGFEQFGIVDFGARMYRPFIGRWLNRDPVEETGGINLYTFTKNNPVSLLDPFGSTPCSPREIPFSGEFLGIPIPGVGEILPMCVYSGSIHARCLSKCCNRIDIDLKIEGICRRPRIAIPRLPTVALDEEWKVTHDLDRGVESCARGSEASGCKLGELAAMQLTVFAERRSCGKALLGAVSGCGPWEKKAKREHFAIHTCCGQ